MSVSWLFMSTYAHILYLFFSGFRKWSSFEKRAPPHKPYFNKKKCYNVEQTLVCWNLPYLKMTWRNFGSTGAWGFVQKNGSFCVKYPSVD